MHIRIALLAATLLIPAGFANAAAPYRTGGDAALRCDLWSNIRHVSPQAAQGVPDLAVGRSGMEQWVLGFIAGISASTPNSDPMAGMDVAGVWAWIDAYCAAHPGDTLLPAGIAFAEAHRHDRPR